MIILYGILAICSGIITAVVLWPGGLFYALLSAPIAGSIVIIASAVVHYATTTLSGRKNHVAGVQPRRGFPGET